MTKIYNYLNYEILTVMPNYIANISYFDPTASGYSISANIWSSEDKIIITFDKFSDETGMSIENYLWYEGKLKEWNSANETEIITDNNIDEYSFLFDWLRKYSDFLQTKVIDVASYSDDSYCWECFPWGFGMAKIYYDDIDGASISASWTVEKFKEAENLPLIHSAEFNYNIDKYGIRLQIYGSPYGIDERITNIINNYEQHKITH